MKPFGLRKIKWTGPIWGDTPKTRCFFAPHLIQLRKTKKTGAFSLQISLFLYLFVFKQLWMSAAVSPSAFPPSARVVTSHLGTTLAPVW